MVRYVETADFSIRIEGETKTVIPKGGRRITLRPEVIEAIAATVDGRGAVVKDDGHSPNVAMEPPRIECLHLIGNTGETVKQTGCGGCGNDRASVWECELHGDVAPLARGTLEDASVRRCVDCGDFRARTDTA